ncbi:MAG: flavodoxin family protein [Bacillota bacterium]
MGVVVGFSGSPVVNGNIDVVIKGILDSTGLPAEFVKLSRYEIRPCIGCLKCASSNRCVQKDDMNTLLDKILSARGIVVGGFPTYFSLNALTKTFLERWFPLKHKFMLTAGKYGVAVAGGFRDTDNVREYLTSFFKWFRMPLIGSITVPGNAPCLSCGFGEECSYSNVPINYGSNRIDPGMFRSACKDTALMSEARKLGKALKGKITIIQS